MTYRDDLEAAQARIQALESELADALRERDEARRERDQARAGAKAVVPPAPRSAPKPAPAQESFTPPPPKRGTATTAALGRLADEEARYREQPTQPHRLALAKTMMALGDWTRAQRLLEQALDHGFQNTGVTRGDVYLQLGLIEAAHVRSAEAMAYYQRGLRHEPDHAGLNAALVALART